MATVLSDRRYAKTHEWVLLDGDVATVGITDFAQEQLMDVVFVDLPETGRAVEAAEAVAAVESSKAAGDAFAPAAGEITEVNEQLEDAPELVNTDPFGEGWLFKMRVSDASALDALLDADAYTAHCEAEEH